MKKIFALFLLICILLCGCSNPYILLNPRRISQKYLVYYKNNALTAYKANNDYIFTATEYGSSEKYVIFNSERVPIVCNGFELIDDCNINNFAEMNFVDVEGMYGSPHVDIGSGFCIPAYVTTNAYLISFHYNTDDNSISLITKYDLFTNEIIERIELPVS